MLYRNGRLGSVMMVVAVGLLGTAIQPVSAGTLGYWRFEEAAFLADSSGNNNTLTRQNSQNGYPLPYTLPTSGAGSLFINPLPKSGLTNATAAGEQAVFYAQNLTIGGSLQTATVVLLAAGVVMLGRRRRRSMHRLNRGGSHDSR